MERGTIEHILERAVWAPSGDNSQPWSFRIDSDTVSIYAHPERDHKILNVEQRGTLLAIGALIENICIAAESVGYKAVLTAALDHAVTVIHFMPQERKTHSLSTSIETRHTHRGPYQKVIPQELDVVLNTLTEPHCSISVVQKREDIATIARAASVLEEVVLYTKQLHRLFFGSIVWSKKESDAGLPGLYIKTTELPPPVQILFRGIRHWSFMQALNKVHFPAFAAASNAKVYAASGAMVAVLLDRTTPEDFIAAGRTMQRVWLTLTSLELAAQPLAGLIYISEYVERTHAPDISAELQKRIKEGVQTLRECLQSENTTLAMLFRVGVPLRPSSARAGRHSLDIV